MALTVVMTPLSTLVVAATRPWWLSGGVMVLAGGASAKKRLVNVHDEPEASVATGLAGRPILTAKITVLYLVESVYAQHVHARQSAWRCAGTFLGPTGECGRPGGVKECNARSRRRDSSTFIRRCTTNTRTEDDGFHGILPMLGGAQGAGGARWW